MRAKRGRKAPGTSAMASVLIKSIPHPTWDTFKRRQLADSNKLGRYLTQEEIIVDLIRQYAEAVTHFGKKHVIAPAPLPFRMPPV